MIEKEAYLIEKEKLISNILNSLKSMPIDMASLNAYLEALKNLRDAHNFGGKDATTDIPDSKGCRLAQGF